MAETIYKIGNKILKIGGKLLTVAGSDPGPTLPPYTIRLKYQDGVTPTFGIGTGVQVSSSPNIWDLTDHNSTWAALLHNHDTLIEVIDANATGVTGMTDIFAGCTALTSVALFDTSSVMDMDMAFDGCTALTSVPLFDTSSCRNMMMMFNGCINVQSGAYALYQQASSQPRVPDHTWAFHNCGSNTVTGAAELAQIPSDWK